MNTLRRIIEGIHHYEERKSFILRVILMGTIIMLGFAEFYVFQEYIKYGTARGGIPLDILSLILLFFILLYVLCKRRQVKVPGLLLIGACYTATTYSAINWGVSLPANLLGFALIITISSIVIGNAFGFFMTGLIFITMLVIGKSESLNQIVPQWKLQVVGMRDVIFYALILFVIMLISWLSNRETEKSLKRAELSEKALEEERDLLEIKVIERTEALKIAQAERVSELYHFAEFGRLSSGLFHDLVNPLFTLSLSIEKLEGSLHSELPEIKNTLQKSLIASRKMERLISAIRRQIKIDTFQEYFLLNSIIDDAILLLNYKAKSENVTIEHIPSIPIYTYNNSLEFQQVMTNIISNAIDSYEGKDASLEKKTVTISVSLENEIIRIQIKDYGSGIKQEVKEKIFDLFFTTKASYKGMGLGLSTTKRIIEKSFNGTIHVDTETESGTCFIITFPQTQL